MTEDDTHDIYRRSVAMSSSMTRPPQEFPQPSLKKIFAMY